ncbi:ribosome recycling factor [Sporosarcina sp. G11-34]|uniref:ribosome recycling factor n=1 Tax=Sporosarcina sp. G11-34 TaxID=2849605 RepID=UPI0022A94B93|nr:ribosome recycling factor [Sporosarcina sp. G11-34]MCZ2258793.1 ribosome recycling factor [Sporosarcina sp. G11-34]
MAKEVLTQANDNMEKALGGYTRALATIRAGRASASMLERITIDYYGSPTPINQVAGVSVPEARLLVIQPYDKTILGDIEKAIMKSDIGITPSNDGAVIRLAVPALTEERRKELVKSVKKEAEEAKVAIRNVRREANEEAKKLEKNSEITEDGLHRSGEDVQKLTDSYIKKIDDIANDKENEIMEI